MERARVEEESRRLQVHERANNVTFEALELLGKSLLLDNYFGDVLALCVREFNAVGGSAWLLDADTGNYYMAANIESGAEGINANVAHPGLTGSRPVVPTKFPYEKGIIYVFPESEFAHYTCYEPYRSYLAERN